MPRQGRRERRAVTEIRGGSGIRIIHLVNRLGYGGAERLVVSLASETHRRGHGVGVVSLLGRGVLEEELRGAGVWTDSLRMCGVPDVRVLARLVSLLRHNGCEVLHTHIARSDLMGLVAGRMAGVPVVVCTRHNACEPWQSVRPLAWLYGVMLSKADGITAVSMAVRQHLERCLGVPAKRCRVLLSGVDLEWFRPRPPDGSLRRRWRLGTGCFVVAVSGRLAREKGVDLAIRAVREVGAACPGVRLLLLGDGPSRQKLEKLAADLGVRERVIFAGWQRNMQRALSVADLVIQPSLTEGLGLAIIEAMAMGKCVVAARVGGIPELIEHNSNGLLVRRRAVGELAGVLAKLALKTAEVKRLGEAARREAVRRFGLTDAVDRLLELYDELLKRGGL